MGRRKRLSRALSHLWTGALVVPVVGEISDAPVRSFFSLRGAATWAELFRLYASCRDAALSVKESTRITCRAGGADVRRRTLGALRLLDRYRREACY